MELESQSQSNKSVEYMVKCKPTALQRSVR